MPLKSNNLFSPKELDGINKKGSKRSLSIINKLS